MKMKIFGLEIRKSKKDKEPVESFMNIQRFGAGRKNAMKLAAVYRCVNVISESVAQLPIDVFLIDAEGYKSAYRKHPAYSLLREYPNPDMTRFIFLKTLVSSVLLEGNGYAYIDRDDFGNAVSLQYIPASYVQTVYINTDGMLRRRYQVTGFQYLVEPTNMIHVLNFSYDGIRGVSTLTHARNTVDISQNSEQYASEFFSNGGNVRGLISVIDGRLKPGQKVDIKKEWADIVANGGIGVLDGNMEYKAISINPADAQMLETREFNVVDICRFFGVSPVKAFDLSKSSYSTVEATQLAFLTDTLAPLLENIELEFKRKVFRPSERIYIEVKFDTTGLLRADKAAQANYLKTLHGVGGITPNEIRKSVDLPKIANGDKAFIPVNMQTLDNAIMVKTTEKEKF